MSDGHVEARPSKRSQEVGSVAAKQDGWASTKGGIPKKQPDVPELPKPPKPKPYGPPKDAMLTGSDKGRERKMHKMLRKGTSFRAILRLERASEPAT